MRRGVVELSLFALGLRSRSTPLVVPAGVRLSRDNGGDGSERLVGDGYSWALTQLKGDTRGGMKGGTRVRTDAISMNKWRRAVKLRMRIETMTMAAIVVVVVPGGFPRHTVQIWSGLALDGTVGACF